MRSTSIFLSLLTVGVFPVMATALPEKYIMEYRMRETPTDPQSDLTFVVRLKLLASDQKGNDVGWEVTNFIIDQYDENGDVSDSWQDFVPFVDTADGLWWITHADANDPQPSEFAIPPIVSGTAPAAPGTTEDLDYSFNGDTYTAPPPPGQPPYPDTVALTYQFVLAVSEETIGEEEEEPAESDGEQDPG